MALDRGNTSCLAHPWFLGPRRWSRLYCLGQRVHPLVQSVPVRARSLTSVVTSFFLVSSPRKAALKTSGAGRFRTSEAYGRDWRS